MMIITTTPDSNANDLQPQIEPAHPLHNPQLHNPVCFPLSLMMHHLYHCNHHSYHRYHQRHHHHHIKLPNTGFKLHSLSHHPSGLRISSKLIPFNLNHYHRHHHHCHEVSPSLVTGRLPRALWAGQAGHGRGLVRTQIKCT